MSNDIYQQEVSEAPIAEPASLELHPDRQAMLDTPVGLAQKPQHSSKEVGTRNEHRHSARGPRRSTYLKESQMAEQKRLEAEARQSLREDRDKDRRAMSKARRPDKDGKYRLGRQSKVLLHRIERIVAEV